MLPLQTYQIYSIRFVISSYRSQAFFVKKYLFELCNITGKQNKNTFLHVLNTDLTQ